MGVELRKDMNRQHQSAHGLGADQGHGLQQTRYRRAPMKAEFASCRILAAIATSFEMMRSIWLSGGSSNRSTAVSSS